MKSTVEQLSPTRVKINVEVPFDELKPDFDRAYKRIAQQVTIPGFRPGKAPARILEQRLGRGVVIDEVVNEAVPAKYTELVNAGTVRPIGRPSIEVTKIEDGDHLAFTAEVDVRPEIEIPSFDQLTVSVDDVEVTDAEVEDHLDGLRGRFGTLVEVDRPVEQGDYVIIDLTITVDGEEVEDEARTGISYEVGSGRLMDGIDEALLGAARDDERTFTTTLGFGAHAGQQAQVTVRVGAVKVRELPAADDDFAQLASEFDTLEELKEDLRSRMDQRKSMQQGAQARDKLMDALLAATEVPLPETLVQEEFDSRRHDAMHVFDHDQQRFADWLAAQGQTEEEFDADLRTNSRDIVKARLVLDAIADAEQITVNETELMERILLQAQRYGISPNEYVKHADTAGELGSLYAELRRNKALGLVMSKATVTNQSGNPIDLGELFGSDRGQSEAASDDDSGATAAEEPAATTADDPAGDPAGDTQGIPPAAPTGTAGAPTDERATPAGQ